MKVKVTLVTIDENKDVSKSEMSAVMEGIEQQRFRIVYVEDLSGDKKMTRTTLIISPKGMRVTRRGEVVSDFIYEEGLVHHSVYQTAYGDIAVTLKTDSYMYNLSETGTINVETVYFLDMGGSPAPAPVKLEIKVEKL